MKPVRFTTLSSAVSIPAIDSPVELDLTGSPTGQAPAMHPEPTFDPSLCREGPFAAANPHPRIGDDKGGCAFRFMTYRNSDFAVKDGHFRLQLHHGSWEWVGAP